MPCAAPRLPQPPHRQARHRGARRPNGGAPLARRPHPAPRVCVGPPLRCGACCGLDRRVVALVASYGVAWPPGAVSEDPACEVSVPALPPRCRQGPVPAGSSRAPARCSAAPAGQLTHRAGRPPTRTIWGLLADAPSWAGAAVIVSEQFRHCRNIGHSPFACPSSRWPPTSLLALWGCLFRVLYVESFRVCPSWPASCTWCDFKIHSRCSVCPVLYSSR